jgi:hypothetical protein
MRLGNARYHADPDDKGVQSGVIWVLRLVIVPSGQHGSA